MQYLVDTNIISEMAKPAPDPGVLEWARDIQSCAISAVTVEEIFYGISWKPNDRVRSWVEAFLQNHAEIVPVSGPIARRAGMLRGQLQARGISRTQADIFIAATAAELGLTVVTHNARDFEGCGVAVLDPSRR